jgi:tellurite resistance protein TehA-like permease
MSFRFYTNVISQASRNVAAGLFIVGLLLIGFGFLVYILRDLFAVLAAIVLIMAGIGCGITAAKIFWAQHQIDKAASDDSHPYRENVRIHIEEHRDE